MTTYLRFFDYDEAFNYYCELIDKMLQCTNKNNHTRIIAKPTLILSIIELMENGKTVNHFTYEEIAPIYQGIFGKFFLKAHKFWHLVWTNAEVKTESPSKAWLDRNTQYAYIDQELWILLSHPTYRDRLKDYIIKEKVLKVFKEEKDKGIFKTLVQLLMII